MFRVIRLGDKTTHGGEVVSAAGNYKIMGKNVAREGDSCTCPIKGHGNCQIVGGDPNWKIDGRSVALQGISKTSCGSELISSCGELTRSFEGEGAASGGAAGAISGFAEETSHSADLHEFCKRWVHDEQVRLMVEATSAQGVPFFIETHDGRVFSGYTDSQGTMPRIDMEEAGTYQVLLYDEAMARMGDVHGHK